MLKAGIIGFGTLGKTIAELIETGHAGNVMLKSVLVRSNKHADHADKQSLALTSDEDDFFNGDLDIIIEAAGHEALHLYGEKVLANGSHLVVLSVGALGDACFYEKLQDVAMQQNRQIFIPSAAIAGLDRIAAGALGEIEDITLITRKHPRSWKGTIAEEKVDLHMLTEPFCIYEGNARESSRLFPQSVNVSAALSLAGIGFENTKVKVYADPTIRTNTHTIKAKGYFGEVEISVSNVPYEENPKSSPIVAMSVAKVLKNLTSPFVIGV
ncbi:MULTISPECIES: aspartate dehydrogenase [unclassified Cytobacillus]|uniref:aspartate dehydrogenase n=1 Tax=unclassified Cytobacillus TaxID=2675268 RepID=UPI00203F443E|nr:aspartate dehydrogenase [Cytobacillus sp. AMY 15.2]MCM3089790.1 aspartate dehydrogenase [Cytobacillus sp. AMY 15.2]